MFYPDSRVKVIVDNNVKEYTIYDLFWSIKIPWRKIYKGYLKDFEKNNINILIEGLNNFYKIKYIYFVKYTGKLVQLNLQNNFLITTDFISILTKYGFKEVKDLENEDLVYFENDFVKASKQVSYSYGELYMYGVLVDGENYKVNGVVIENLDYLEKWKKLKK